MSKRVQKWLKVELTQDELLETGRTLAERHIAKTKLEAEKKDAVATFTFRIKQVDSDIAKLSEVYSTGVEERPVMCREFINLDIGVHQTYREDTGALVEERKLLPHEKQGTLTLSEQDEIAAEAAAAQEEEEAAAAAHAEAMEAQEAADAVADQEYDEVPPMSEEAADGEPQE